MNIINISEVNKREDFGLFLNTRGLTNIAVEVGVHRGASAVPFLNKWNGKTFYAIDIWDKFDGDEIGISETRYLDHLQAVNVLNQFRDRIDIRILKATSVKGSEIVPNNDIDFVYIDANHQYEYVKQDIEVWYPKIKYGGIIGGHDYVFNSSHGSLDVKKAVDEFAINNNKDIYFIPNSSSWYIIK